MKKILMVYPSKEVRERLTAILEEAHFQVVTAENSGAILKMLHQTHADVAVIPDDEVVRREVCAPVRAMFNIPIVVLGEGDQTAQIDLLQLGADVYLTPDVSAVEIVARIHSLLRRYPRHRKGNPTLEPDMNQVKLGEQAFTLPPTEFRLLSCLLMSEGRVVPYSQLIDNVWGNGVSLDSLHFCVRRLKRRLGIDSIGPYRLLQHRGQGYRFCEDQPTFLTTTPADAREPWGLGAKPPMPLPSGALDMKGLPDG